MVRGNQAGPLPRSGSRPALLGLAARTTNSSAVSSPIPDRPASDAARQMCSRRLGDTSFSSWTTRLRNRHRDTDVLRSLAGPDPRSRAVNCGAVLVWAGGTRGDRRLARGRGPGQRRPPATRKTTPSGLPSCGLRRRLVLVVPDLPKLAVVPGSLPISGLRAEHDEETAPAAMGSRSPHRRRGGFSTRFPGRRPERAFRSRSCGSRDDPRGFLGGWLRQRTRLNNYVHAILGRTLGCSAARRRICSDTRAGVSPSRTCPRTGRPRRRRQSPAGLLRRTTAAHRRRPQPWSRWAVENCGRSNLSHTGCSSSRRGRRSSNARLLHVSQSTVVLIFAGRPAS